MIDQTPIARKAILTLSLIVVLSFGNKLVAQNGEAIFKDNCATCHSLTKRVSGPALAGIQNRVPDKKLLADWIHNSPKVLASGNAYFNKLYEEYNKSPMPPFPQFSAAEIDALIEYISTPPPAEAAPTTGPDTQAKPEGNDSAILYGVLTLILAVVALIMLQVNSNLKKLSDDASGVHASEPIPFFRNKTYIALITVVLFVVGGYYVVKGAIGLGRQQNYQPEQPIFYSHKVHAGTNQINCLYCHGSAFEGQQATIPSVNVCMNCHMTITEYSGKEKLRREDGTEVDGTAEIQKIYAAAGWDPKTRRYTGNEKAVEWVRIHNLPDHVYFNHSQHTKVGGVQCQTCHGQIDKMHEVYQASDLSMGWCVNCHRETKVDFYNKGTGEGNKFYSIYEKFHNDIQSGKLDSVTVEKIGGTECQKCHY